MGHFCFIGYFLAVSCRNPSDGTFVNLPPGGRTLTLHYFHVNHDGTFSETDTGRTVIIDGAEDFGVLIYTEALGSSETNSVIFHRDDGSTVTFLFVSEQNFPSAIAIADGSQISYAAFLYHCDASRTFSVAFVRGEEEEYEVISEINALPMPRLEHEDYAGLSPGLHRRFHNARVASSVYNSLSAYLEAFQGGSEEGMRRLPAAGGFQRASGLAPADFEGLEVGHRSMSITLGILAVGGAIWKGVKVGYYTYTLVKATNTVYDMIYRDASVRDGVIDLSITAAQMPMPTPLSMVVTGLRNVFSSSLSGTVSISGNLQVGQRLTVNTANLGGSGTISYRWERGTSLGTGSIAGATGPTYTVQGADARQWIRVVVTRSGRSGSVASQWVGPVTAPLTGTVSITGTPQVGRALTASTAILVSSGVLSFQWLRGTTPIAGATGRTYTVQSADVGQTISVVVTSSGNSGNRTSPAVGPVTPAPPPPLTGTVSITGTPQVGQTLTANTASLGGSGAISFQWERGTTPIAGATGATYVVQNADVGQTIRVVATRAGNSGNVASARTATVIAAPTFGISLDMPTNHAFSSLEQGYSAGERQAVTVTVTNAGNQPTGSLNVALSGANAGSFTLSSTSIPSISAGGSATFTVIPNTGLAVGTYSATVTVTGGANIQAHSFGVSFAVIAVTPVVPHALFTFRHVSGGLEVTGYTGTATAVDIPATHDGFPVVSIGDGAFAGSFALRLTSVTIPNSVTNIGERAFQDNQLTSVTIPNGVTSIGTWAFMRNQLTTVTIPSSVTVLGSSAFENNQLTSVTIPNSVTSMGNSTFRNNQLTSVTIPSSVTSTGVSTFENNRLTSVIIPNSVTIISTFSFRGNQLTSVIDPLLSNFPLSI